MSENKGSQWLGVVVYTFNRGTGKADWWIPLEFEASLFCIRSSRPAREPVSERLIPWD